ncbi:hypothetical protein ACFLX5_00210 [Chloroflexota bacterium]
MGTIITLDEVFDYLTRKHDSMTETRYANGKETESTERYASPAVKIIKQRKQ